MSKPNSLLQIVPLPNNYQLTSNNSNVSGFNNGNIQNYNPNGNYIITASSIANYSLDSNNTQPFNIFNGKNNSFWQCDYLNNPKFNSYVNGYPKYSQDPYNSMNSMNNSSMSSTNNTISTASAAISQIPSTYQGGGDKKNTWSTALTTVNNTNNNQVSIPGEWVQIQIPYSVYLNQYSIMTPSYTNNISTFPLKFTVVGSNDGSSWYFLDNRDLSIGDLPNSNNPLKVFNFNSINNYSYFRLIISELCNGMTNIKINQWNLFGSINISINPKSEGFTNIMNTTSILPYYSSNMTYESFDNHNYMTSSELNKKNAANTINQANPSNDPNNPNSLSVSDINKFQISPMIQISSDYSNLLNKIQQNNTDLSNNIVKITNQNRTGIRDKLEKNDIYDYRGDLLYYYQPKPTVTDAMIEDTNAIIMQQNYVYILGAITTASLLVFAIMLARE